MSTEKEIIEKEIKEFKELIKPLKKFIKKQEKMFDIPDIMLRRSLNEAWFSDTLAWLLDPKTEDDFGVIFINNFVKHLAKKRSNANEQYKRENYFLRFADQKAGRSVTGKNRLSLKNIAVMREYYLSKFDYKKKKGSAQFADIALFDLDSKDGLFITIENKLFSTNHPYQLETYFKLVEDKYKSVKTREYVYLTLAGEFPVKYKDNCDEKILDGCWLRLGWTDDILKILEKSIEDNKKINNKEVSYDVDRLLNMLRWLKNMVCQPKELKYNVEMLLDIMIRNATKVLTCHLNRLSVEGRTWTKKPKIESSIKHSSVPARVLYVQILPNLTVTIQGKSKSKKFYEKILIPFGAYPDQVYHLMYLAARNVYYKHFERPEKYLNNKKKLTKTRLLEEQVIEPLLEFIYHYKFQLQTMLSTNKTIRKANIIEELDDYKELNEGDK